MAKLLSCPKHSVKTIEKNRLFRYLYVLLMAINWFNVIRTECTRSIDRFIKSSNWAIYTDRNIKEGCNETAVNWFNVIRTEYTWSIDRFTRPSKGNTNHYKSWPDESAGPAAAIIGSQYGESIIGMKAKAAIVDVWATTGSARLMTKPWASVTNRGQQPAMHACSYWWALDGGAMISSRKPADCHTPHRTENQQE